MTTHDVVCLELTQLTSLVIYPGVALPVPRLFYPLNHISQGHEITGKGFDARFIDTGIEDDNEDGNDDERPGGVLRLKLGTPYTEIDNSNNLFTFEVCIFGLFLQL